MDYLSKLNISGIVISFILSSSLAFSLYIESPIAPYHPDTSNLGMDLGVFMGYQVMLLLISMVGYRRITNLAILFFPVAAYLLYRFEVANHIAHTFHMLMDGPWLGLDSQDVAFDKQSVAVNLITLSIFVLFSYYFIPRHRTWDRSFSLLVGVAMIWVIIAYHVALYFLFWKPHFDTHKAFISDTQQEVIEHQSGCATGYQIICSQFDAHSFPSHPLFDGNPKVLESEVLATDINSTHGSQTLYYSSVDDAYMPMYISLGFLSIIDNSRTLIYSNQMSPLFMTYANGLGLCVSLFMAIWLYGGYLLSLFHRAKGVNRA